MPMRKSFLWGCSRVHEMALLRIIGEYAGAEHQHGSFLLPYQVEPFLPEGWTLPGFMRDREFYILKFVVTQSRRSICNIELQLVWKCFDKNMKPVLFPVSKITAFPYAALRINCQPVRLTKSRWVEEREDFHFGATTRQYTLMCRLYTQTCDALSEIDGATLDKPTSHKVHAFFWELMRRRQRPTNYTIRATRTGWV